MIIFRQQILLNQKNYQHMSTNRREFIRRSAAATAVIGISSSFPTLKAGILGANEKLVCGAIGVKGMGFADLKTFLNQPNTECAALCDVDDNVLQERIGDVEGPGSDGSCTLGPQGPW